VAHVVELLEDVGHDEVFVEKEVEVDCSLKVDVANLTVNQSVCAVRCRP